MHTITADQWSEQLLEVLECQQSLADRLAGLSQQQQALIESDQADALLNLLARRQEIVDQFLEVQDRFTELTTDLDAKLAQFDAGQRTVVRSRINAISTQLNDVMQRDAQDQQRLQSARQRVMSDIGQVGASRKAGQAYRSATDSSPRYTDRKG